MELRHLRYFLAVAEYSHFRNAAESLLVSQPTLSQQIRDLETELGVDLFERLGRRVRLTQEGETFREYAQRAIGVLDEGEEVLRQYDAMLRGRLSVGVIQTANVHWIPEVTAKFVKEHPQVRLSIQELSAGEIEDGVIDGRLDIGVSFAATSGREIEQESLFREDFALIVPKAHPLAVRKRIRVRDLSNEPLCLLNRSFCTRRLIEDGFRQAKTDMLVQVEMNSIEGIMATVSRSGLPTILPRLATGKHPVVVVKMDDPGISRQVCLLHSKGRRFSRARDVFCELIRRKARELAS